MEPHLSAYVSRSTTSLGRRRCPRSSPPVAACTRQYPRRRPASRQARQPRPIRHTAATPPAQTRTRLLLDLLLPADARVQEIDRKSLRPNRGQRHRSGSHRGHPAVPWRRRSLGQQAGPSVAHRDLRSEPLVEPLEDVLGEAAGVVRRHMMRRRLILPRRQKDLPLDRRRQQIRVAGRIAVHYQRDVLDESRAAVETGPRTRSTWAGCTARSGRRTRSRIGRCRRQTPRR